MPRKLQSLDIMRLLTPRISSDVQGTYVKTVADLIEVYEGQTLEPYQIKTLEAVTKLLKEQD